MSTKLKKATEVATIDYKTALTLEAVLGNAKINSQLMTPMSVVTIIDLKEELSKKREGYFKAVAVIMESYGVKEKDGNYEFAEHEQMVEIQGKLNELDKTQVSVNSLNRLSKNEYIGLCSDQSVNNMQYLKKYLTVVEKEND